MSSMWIVLLTTLSWSQTWNPQSLKAVSNCKDSIAEFVYWHWIISHLKLYIYSVLHKRFLLFSDLKFLIWPIYVSEQTTSYCFRKHWDTEYLVFILVASEPDLSKVQQQQHLLQAYKTLFPSFTLQTFIWVVNILIWIHFLPTCSPNY